ncbi:MAG: tRNA (N(6)-L-threonylcarbamoyladenosine(37)-C(2))-methylthiotransferase MtaB [Clostridia bacterium]|nr:tRNA (N(6)-L-threonylcarbamoyladenosine(37)-C(2))-methylthiotransferase MtaB [Clostridia bacterium]MBR2643886.1 tRNA (N(6)-L-threonylcarbamoyladenosine(37)-C(2))-methylthiotransferase MtaB [Clostridia bacterium]
MKVAFYTLGCKVNHYETQAMEELFRAAGHEVVPFEDEADAYVVNTCTVTQIGDKKSRQIISQAHRRNPSAVIAAVGCYAEVARESVAKLDGVSLVLGTDGRKDIVRYVERATHEKLIPKQPEPFARRTFEELSAQHDSRTRATLKVQDGCNSFCSYCIIPYARGALRSRTLESTKRELETLAKNGYREVVLTGIQLSLYGIDLEDKPELSDLIALADGIEGIERLRLGSLEPRVITDRFLKVAQNSRTLCRQFHLALQSGSDSVLRRMNRRYTTAEYRDAVDRIRACMPDAAITTDVIAGFVGETEAEHEETKAFLKEIGFARIHVFPYSRRKGTRADAMEGHLTRAVKEARARELIAIGDATEKAFIDGMIGETVTVIMEDDGTGYTGNYVRVRCDGVCGETVRAKLVSREGTTAIGTII